MFNDTDSERPTDPGNCLVRRGEIIGPDVRHFPLAKNGRSY